MGFGSIMNDMVNLFNRLFFKVHNRSYPGQSNNLKINICFVDPTSFLLTLKQRTGLFPAGDATLAGILAKCSLQYKQGYTTCHQV